jgi:hypothetical protein
MDYLLQVPDKSCVGSCRDTAKQTPCAKPTWHPAPTQSCRYSPDHQLLFW